ncbi:MAG: hypothetical protein ACYDH2_13260 [Anaerolineaceae bacterium]
MIGQIEYYEQAARDYRTSFKKGQICYAPVPYYLNGMVIHCSIEYLKSKNPGNYSLITQASSLMELDKGSLPDITELGYDRDTFLPLLPHKFRPVILITDPIPNLKINSKEYGALFVVVPMYSICDDKLSESLSDRFLLNLQGYKYPSLFYLPENDQFAMKESIARFDRIMVFQSECLSPKPVQLTVDATYCLNKWLLFFLGGELDEIIGTYREEALKNIK